MKKSLLGLTLAASVTFAPAAHANLLTNGDFENGNSAGWTLSGNTSYFNVLHGCCFGGGIGPESGSWFVLAGPSGSDGYLSQTFADTSGEKLLVTGWVYGVGDIVSDFGMSFNGAQEIELSNPNTNGWEELSFYVTGTGLDTLTLNFRDDPAYVAFDNFSVQAATGVPEPGTLALFGAALLALGGLGLRRKVV